MKKNIISGSLSIFFGLLITLGPKFLFKVCGIEDADIPRCHWAFRAEICAGIVITALGICLIIFSDLKIQLGLTISGFLMGIVTFIIPIDLFIGGCQDKTAVCRTITFPILYVLGAIVVIGAVINMLLLERKIKQ